MINPVSFGSTYKISKTAKDSLQQQKGYDRIEDFCYARDISYMQKISTKKKDSHPYGSFEYKAEITVVASDEKDSDIETFCSNNGIKFTKYQTNQLMQPQAIRTRIAPPQNGFVEARVDVEKLNELLKNQKDNNLEHCKSDYEKYYKERTDFMLKSGDEIPATTLYITPWGTNEEALDYIHKWGKEHLNPDSISVMLCQRTNDPDHCMFFAMQDAGIKNVPVYLDKNSFQLGLALGILK